jgi:hypothetical protein
MEAKRSSETSVLTRATRRTIPDDGILHSLRCEHLKSYEIRIMPVPAELELETLRLNLAVRAS